MAKKIHKSNTYNTIHVQDQIRFLACSDLFNFKGVIKQWSSREIVSHKFLEYNNIRMLFQVYIEINT